MSNINELGTAVITGASSGLGEVLSDRLAGKGYNLLLIARRKERLEQIAQALEKKYGVGVEIISADLADATDLERVSDKLSANTDITMLINNAGGTVISTFADAPLDKQLNMINLNLVAPVRLTEAVVKNFKHRNRGTLINIGSAVGFNSLVFTSVYSGTKAFIDKFTQGLQEEFKDSGVKIFLVAPAGVATDIYENAGFDLSSIDPEMIMTIDNCVDAILNGVSRNELTILPSVEDYQLFQDYENARLKLFAATQTGKAASRYQNTHHA